MSIKQKALVCLAALCGLFAGGYAVRAQTRFEAFSRENVGSAPGLSVVSVRDMALNACYTLFILEPGRLAAPAPFDAASIADAARERDRQLLALSAEFERGLSGAVPATLGSNPLRFQWEADKIQSDYEHVVRQSEIARIGEQLERIASAQRIAAVGAPCDKPATSGTRIGR